MTDTDLPLAWRDTPSMAGRYVSLVPLEATHLEGLRKARDHAGLDGLWFTNTPSMDDMPSYLDAALQARDEGKVLPFAVLDPHGELVGTTRFYGLEPSVPRISIGYTWYAPRVQRTGANTETKLLLLGYAFDTLGSICVNLETSTLNARSRAAIARLGAKQDGILRNHKRHADGSPRDTVMFSIIDGEWPEVKRNLRAKLQQHGNA
ncbi:GNAT family N-acetyltransferase [Rhodanobacter sp. 7MK24]|uniref:GNAT family N-acetyltransferase n=1 Tax=Rhodanobacter sp. 7MK24 TaxID=2775922 RepID=UPI00177E8FA1|nr:GNAT family protein [Rhodanobacter sp. 7MK24]MBD8880399.1 GNAT family N-acetyltransferase [Rhodanobacter sp. 7MK24]